MHPDFLFDNATTESSSSGAYFTGYQSDILRIATIAPSSLSLLGSAAMIISLLAKGGSHLRLLMCLSASDLLSNLVVIASLVHSDEFNNGACNVFGFLVTYTELCPIFWTGCISLCLFLSVFAKHLTGKKGVHYFWYYFAVSFGLPLIPAIIGMARDDYGDAGYGMCWVQNPDKRLYYFYAPLWIIIAFNIVVYVKVTRAYMKGHLEQHGTVLSVSTGISRVGRLRYYPTLLVVCWIFGTVRRLLEAVDPSIEIFPLYVVHTVFSRLQGLLNAIVYGTDPLQQFYPWVISWFAAETHKDALLPINEDDSNSEDDQERSVQSAFTSSL